MPININRLKSELLYELKESGLIFFLKDGFVNYGILDIAHFLCYKAARIVIDINPEFFFKGSVSKSILAHGLLFLVTF